MREIDPQVFGPGSWTVSHVLAIVCDDSGTSDDFKFYTVFTYRMLHALPCSKCRAHAVRYLDKFPIPKTSEEGSLFEWSVIFHNVVNKRLKKMLMSLEEARQIYSNTELVLKSKKGTTCSIVSGSTGCEDKPIYSQGE